MSERLNALVTRLCEQVVREENEAVERWLASHITLADVFAHTLVQFPHRPGYYELRREDEVVSTLEIKRTFSVDDDIWDVSMAALDDTDE